MRSTCRIEYINLVGFTKIIRKKIDVVPRVGIILGSGLGGFTDHIAESSIIKYSEIPGYPISTVPGHAGEFIIGYVSDIPVICAKGRFHYYEGHSIETVTLPIEVFNDLGCDTVIVTNAAGCIRREWKPGDLMLITSLLDFTFMKNGLSIKSMNEIVDSKLGLIIEASALKHGINLHQGMYAWTLGPSYETPAEVQKIRSMGGDAVGMSTYPEISKAKSINMKVLGISCLSNYAAGITDKPLTHQEVLEVVDNSSNLFSILVKEVLYNI